VRFNADFVYLPNGLDGESVRIDPELYDDDEEEAADNIAHWDDTFLELIVWDGMELDGLASTTADLLNTLSGDVLAGCWV